MRLLPYRDLAAGRVQRAADRAARRQLGLRYVGLLWVSVTVHYGDGEFVRREPKELYSRADGAEYVKWGMSDYRPRFADDDSNPQLGEPQ